MSSLQQIQQTADHGLDSDDTTEALRDADPELVQRAVSATADATAKIKQTHDSEIRMLHGFSTELGKKMKSSEAEVEKLTRLLGTAKMEAGMLKTDLTQSRLLSNKHRSEKRREEKRREENIVE
jgi:hypothetical protein